MFNFFALLETDESEILTVFMGLKSNSAPGCDNISTLLKMARKQIVPVISRLTNLCFKTSIFSRLFFIIYYLQNGKIFAYADDTVFLFSVSTLLI